MILENKKFEKLYFFLFSCRVCMYMGAFVYAYEYMFRFMYVCICLDVYMCLWEYVYVSMCKFWCVYMYILYVCIYIYLYVCVSVCMFACVCLTTFFRYKLNSQWLWPFLPGLSGHSPTDHLRQQSSTFPPLQCRASYSEIPFTGFSTLAQPCMRKMKSLEEEPPNIVL